MNISRLIVVGLIMLLTGCASGNMVMMPGVIVIQYDLDRSDTATSLPPTSTVAAPSAVWSPSPTMTATVTATYTPITLPTWTPSPTATYTPTAIATATVAPFTPVPTPTGTLDPTPTQEEPDFICAFAQGRPHLNIRATPDTATSDNIVYRAPFNTYIYVSPNIIDIDGWTWVEVPDRGVYGWAAAHLMELRPEDIC